MAVGLRQVKVKRGMPHQRQLPLCMLRNHVHQKWEVMRNFLIMNLLVKKVNQKVHGKLLH